MKIKKIFSLYLLVGSVCAVIDLFLFKIFLIADFGIVVSATISFIVATFVNYWLCRYIIFNKGSHNFVNQISGVFLVSTVGIIFNVGIVFFLTDTYSVPPMISKVIAIATVFLWNFSSRLLIVFRNNYREMRSEL